jgi:ATP-dependent Zn protease
VAIEAAPAPLLDIATGSAAGRAPVSEDLQRRVDAAIRALVANGLEQARAVLQQHRALLERGAQELTRKETLDEQAIGAYRDALRGG